MFPAMNPHLKEIATDVLYHFGLDSTMDLPGMFRDVRLVCMGGSNDRMLAFAQRIAGEVPAWNVHPSTIKPFGTTERFALYKVGPVLSVSHGMGIGSIRIMLNEITKLLHHAGAEDFQYIRIGTCGGIGVAPGTVILTEKALNPKLEAKDEVVTIGHVRSYQTTFDRALTSALYKCRGDIPAIHGKTVATNCFYEEQTRLDGAIYPSYTHEEQQAFLHHLQDIGVRSYEMEATALAGFCNRAGIPAADTSVVIVNRLEGDQITSTHTEIAAFSNNAQNLVLLYIQQQFVHAQAKPGSMSAARPASELSGQRRLPPTLPLLRDRTLPTAAFRTAARPIIQDIVQQLQAHLSARDTQKQNVVFVIILRAGLAFLEEITRQFPSSPIACAGLRRDEETAKAHWYYKNFPFLSKKNTAVILDPMLATGGSAMAVTRELQHRGCLPPNIHFAGLLGAPEGIAALSKILPNENILLAQIDEGLDAQKFIVPGLGDFGDRYFGYVPTNLTSAIAPNIPRTTVAAAPRS